MTRCGRRRLLNGANVTVLTVNIAVSPRYSCPRGLYSRQRMHVLVDFDNIPPAIQQQGTVYIADRIFQSLSPNLRAGDRLELRLYGGWDQAAKLTPKAQRLHAELVGSFPRTFNLAATSAGGTLTLVMTAALADSLLIEPTVPLRDTYRLRPPSRRLVCEDPQASGCGNHACPLMPLSGFLSSQTTSRMPCTASSRTQLS